MEKTCTGCGRVQPITSYNFQNGYRRSRCKSCDIEYTRQYRARKRVQKLNPIDELTQEVLDELQHFPVARVAKKHGLKYTRLNYIYTRYIRDKH
jgi:hypothetical protein